MIDADPGTGWLKDAARLDDCGSMITAFPLLMLVFPSAHSYVYRSLSAANHP